MMADRFDLESQIMNAWQVVEDLQLLYRKAGEGELSADEWANALLGLATIYTLRFQELFETFESVIKAGALGPEPGSIVYHQVKVGGND